MSLMVKHTVKLTAGTSILLTFDGTRNRSRLRGLAYRSNLMNVKPATTGFDHLVGSKLWQH